MIAFGVHLMEGTVQWMFYLLAIFNDGALISACVISDLCMSACHATILKAKQTLLCLASVKPETSSEIRLLKCITWHVS